MISVGPKTAGGLPAPFSVLTSRRPRCEDPLELAGEVDLSAEPGLSAMLAKVRTVMGHHRRYT
jgi:hypothetical protein